MVERLSGFVDVEKIVEVKVRSLKQIDPSTAVLNHTLVSRCPDSEVPVRVVWGEPITWVLTHQLLSIALRSTRPSLRVCNIDP